MTNKTEERVRVSIYFGANSKPNFERLKNLSKHTGLKLSRVAVMAVNFGLTILEEKLLEPSELLEKDRLKKK
jgi:NAD-specific glutamate dehydrogenase